MKILNEALKNIIEKLSDGTRLNKKMLVAVSLLLAGMTALILTEVSDTKSKTAQIPQTETSCVYSADNYVTELENRLVSIISAIEGAGETKVMVTLESGSENVYLHDYDYGENVEPSGRNSIERKDEYVIIDGDEGERGIVVRVAEPKIRGVAVVCRGAGSETVKSQIVEAVTALLDISSARVSVAKMN